MAAPRRSIFPYSGFGVDQVGYCIVARKDLVKNNPDLVKRFVQATIKAYKETEETPMRRSPRWPTLSAAR